MPRRPASEPLPKPAPRTLKFGWCMDGYHHQCRVAYVDHNDVTQQCACECHKAKKTSD